MIWICIPVYNGIKYTLACVESLMRQTYRDFKIVIADDGSSDNTELELRCRYRDELIILKGDGNLWWAGAMNLCFDYVLKNSQAEDYVLMLNNDLIVENDYLLNLINNIKENEVLGSVVYDINNKSEIVYAGELLKRFSAKSVMIHRQSKKNIEKEFWYSDLLTGRGTLLPVSLLKKIGKLRNYIMPQYGADSEFSVRASKAGYRLKFCRKVCVYSHAEKTGPGSVYRKVPLKIFLYSFFSMRSPNYYKSRFYFARSYTPAFWVPLFLLFQIFWISGGYLKRSLFGAK